MKTKKITRKFKFKATMLEGDKRTGYKKNRCWEPKGFYYNHGNIIVVGDEKTGDTIRIGFPIDKVKIDIGITDFEVF